MVRFVPFLRLCIAYFCLVEVLSAFSTSTSTPRPKGGEPVPFSATATMPLDTQSEVFVVDTGDNEDISLMCAWFYPAAAKADTKPVFYDEFHNVTLTNFLFQYEQGTGTSVQVTFTCGLHLLFVVPSTGSTTPTTSNLIADGDFSRPVVSGSRRSTP